ncbi:MAG: hypothetical protein O7H41_10110 [Planctomycetota bacterium]|nr:hypothetical protein [Planctomycetota bacterium]
MTAERLRIACLGVLERAGHRARRRGWTMGRVRSRMHRVRALCRFAVQDDEIDSRLHWIFSEEKEVA